MFFALLLALTGLTLSAVAIYYSVIGLTAIFAAAFWPVVVMGTTLEVAKLVAASWLKMYWTKIPSGMKVYMTASVIVLMFITSMGIFGFLSKAHSDQTLVSGDVISKISLIDEKIKIERENIANAQSIIKQMDAAVTGISASGNEREIKLRDGTSYTRSAAEQALQVRRSQAKDRANLTKQIEESQAKIIKLQEESAPIRAEMRKVEAEVGPIKYIAKLIYGDNPDTNLLEKAVTWVIITIIFVFDPLAVLLILGSQMTYQWYKEERKDELVQETTPPEGTGEETPTPPQSDSGKPDEGSGGESQQNSESSIGDDVAEEANRKIAEIEQEEPTTYVHSDWPFPNHRWSYPETVKENTEEEPKNDVEEVSALDEWNKMIEEAEREAEKEKTAKQQWKQDNPDDTLKRQEKLMAMGEIDTLPWDVVKDPKYQIFPELQSDVQKTPEPDFPKQDRIKPDFTEVIEPEDSKKKNYIVKEDEHQIKKTRS